MLELEHRYLATTNESMDVGNNHQWLVPWKERQQTLHIPPNGRTECYRWNNLVKHIELESDQASRPNYEFTGYTKDMLNGPWDAVSKSRLWETLQNRWPGFLNATFSQEITIYKKEPVRENAPKCWKRHVTQKIAKYGPRFDPNSNKLSKCEQFTGYEMILVVIVNFCIVIMVMVRFFFKSLYFRETRWNIFRCNNRMTSGG